MVGSEGQGGEGGTPPPPGAGILEIKTSAGSRDAICGRNLTPHPNATSKLRCEIQGCSLFLPLSHTQAPGHVTLQFGSPEAERISRPHGAWAWLCDFLWPQWGHSVCHGQSLSNLLVQLGMDLCTSNTARRDTCPGWPMSPRRKRNRCS